MRSTSTLALALTACQAAPTGHTGVGPAPEITTAPVASTGGGSSSSGSSGTSTGEDSNSGAGSTSEPVRDLGGVPDFGDDAPLGCRGKIDFLFVISRQANMVYRQAQLAAAFPQFIATIQSKFADFDYHIMVVDGDSGWGTPVCTKACASPGCSVGEPCCGYYAPDKHGQPCCDPDYPCQDLDLLTACDWAWGAGTVFPAGVSGEANKPCPIDGGRRYLKKGQTNLEEAFKCIATVGTSGYDLLGQALTAAMQSNINDPGGCNNGFLRKDALLMVTFIATNYDELSEGSPDKWAQAVIDAKRGDDSSVVMFAIGGMAECNPYDRICQLITMFPYHHSISVAEPDYGPGFAKAASLVETACAGFTPPPG